MHSTHLLRSVLVGYVLAGGWMTGAVASLPPLSVRAQANGATLSREQGIDFVSVHAQGNSPWPGAENTNYAGRGAVSKNFRIGRTEITSGQWAEFINTIGPLDVTESLGLTTAAQAGFYRDFDYGGPGYKVAMNPFVSHASMQPVIGITWYNAARYCNWLHNGKQASLESLRRGAYDTSTWGRTPEGSLTDAPTHEAGAKYWIPSLDELFAALYFDPSRNGPGQAGWWTQPNASDQPLIPGAPESGGETSAAYDFVYPDRPELGAYGAQQSPWGLLDGSGGGQEWTEEYFGSAAFPFGRIALGSSVLNASTFLDQIGTSTQGGLSSLRIATTIPAPSGVVAFAICSVSLTFRNRRRTR